ncbi:MAG: hypothetical protein N2561_07415 [Bacteroidetes bacterium]|nr:hypothetical protein [Rhodothermia bacterium]MCS7155062.1 hypothetical protein [Bacteroidota bacterium]MCX7907346.1 hypothetical protein [Bacteroidota bacterium]MDW8137927.1 hypothetical protein [Bacteroidota bacterium]MDW8286221.1 hypothetical protein [Bacteroidota bacterium]
MLAFALGAMVVALAIVVGIQAFRVQEIEHRRDRAYLFCLQTATQARAYYRTPRDLGGGGFSFAGFDFHKMGLLTADDPLLYKDREGTQYKLEPQGPERLRLVAFYVDDEGTRYLAICVIRPDTAYLEQAFQEGAEP